MRVVTTLEGALLVPPRYDAAFPLRVGRASPPQNGGVAVRLGEQWQAAAAAEHQRAGASATQPIEEWPMPSSAPSRLRGLREAVYLGVAVDQFGHFLAESIHRAWALRDPRIADRVPGVMLVPHGAAQPRGYQRDALELLGVRPDRVRWARRPTPVARLHVPALAAQFGEPADPAYLDERRAVALAALGSIPDAGTVYLHKPLRHSRSVTAGAGWLAAQLAEHGVRTVIPEAMPLREQVRVMAGARHVLADQGSPLRVLELLGRTDASVTVLARAGWLDRFAAFLSPRSPDAVLAECVHALPAPPAVTASTWRFAALCRFDPDALEAAVGDRLGIALHLDRRALRAAELRDIAQWMRVGPSLYVAEEEIRAGLDGWWTAISSSAPGGRGSAAP